jgi:polysaccharide chain length determinant protein (PEP-CTERM system associated)
MIPGKTYTPDEIAAVVWRWKWLIVLPCVIGAIGAFAYARTLKDLYRSEAVIMMTPQRVREDLVRSTTVRSTLAERIQTISQQIMSRTRLESIIVDLNLYQEDRRTGLMEDIVERMRRDVTVQTVRGDAFRVAYVSESPITAMRVAERLAGLFIDENLKDREQMAQGTSQFLESQLEDARKRLVEQETRLEAYRRAHAGQLPSQVDSNLAAINGAQLQMQRLQDSVARDRDQLQLLERQLADATSPEAAAAEPVLDSASASVSGGSARQQLETARAALRNMELRLKPEHPDIGRMRRLIASLEKKAEKEALDVPLTPDAPAARPRSKAELAQAIRLREMELKADRLRTSIAAMEAEQDRVRSTVGVYQQRLDAAPTRETELIELTRDYDAIKRLYASLLSKSEDSKLSVNLEARQVGQQFRILEQARVPARPYSPNRNRLYGMGAFGGAGLGLGLVFLIVYRDSSLKTDDDVTGSLALPVLALVPMMQTTADRRWLRRRRILLGGASAVLVIGLVGGVAWWVVTRT